MSTLTATVVPHVRLLRFATSLFLALTVITLFAQAADSGRVEGVVTSKTSGNALQGASVKIVGQNITALTDNTGRFVLFNVPAGSVTVTAGYNGFEEQTQAVTVSNEAQTANFALTDTDVLKLEKFVVQSQKEGQALSVTEQRNADNIKNVVALDEWGVLPTQNVGELFARMPGVSYQVDEDNLINNISIRGQPTNFTTLNIDGMSSTGVSGVGRGATLHSFSASMYEQIELISGVTPEKRADSLGGSINLKTKSPMAMSEKRRINYTASGIWAASWGDRNTPLEDHPLGADFSLNYTERFDVFGGKRNLGISAAVSYQEIVRPFDYDLLQYENTTNPTAYFRDYDKRSGLNHRFIEAFSLRADYRIASHTTVSARFLYNKGDEPFFHYTFVNPFISTSLTIYDPVTNPTGGIMPGYTANRTEIRPAGNAQLLLTPRRFSFTSYNPTGTIAFEHDFGRLKIDHAYRWSNTRWYSAAGSDGQNGQLTLRTAQPIGFILDNSDLNGRVFTQTSGPSVYDAASYASILTAAANTTTIPVPQTSMIFNKRSTVTRTNEVIGNINFSYLMPTSTPITLKAGLDTDNRRVNNYNDSPRRWYAVPGTVLSGPMMPYTEFDRQNAPTGLRVPAFDPTDISRQLSNTAVWYEDVNFTATQNYTNRRIFEEGVDAGYVQGTAKFGRLTALGGVRAEQVSVVTFTYFRARTTPIAVEPDHFKRAALDYQAQSTNGSYTKYFPSIHLSYDITSNLKARASWSTSYGRPTLAQLVPAVVISDTAQTVTIGDPAIKPQYSKNIDLKLEYYFKNSGVFTASVYQKDISDLIGTGLNSGIIVPSTPDNGFDGLYGGYVIVRPTNIGDARVRGFELDYKQSLTFLPGALKGLTVRANYTWLEAEGKYTGATALTTNQVANFVPRTFNAGLLYTYKKFGASLDMNFTGEYPQLINIASPGNGNVYRRDLSVYNIGFTYRIMRNATIFITANNFTENGPELYTYTPSRARQLLISPTFVKFGVTGQF